MHSKGKIRIPRGKKIPQSAARMIAQAYGYDCVVILGCDQSGRRWITVHEDRYTENRASFRLEGRNWVGQVLDVLMDLRRNPLPFDAEATFFSGR